MATQKAFLNALSASFVKFLETGSRSTEKLKILHGQIAKDLHRKLGDGGLVLSQGFGTGKEGKLDGRYVEKAVDITLADGAGRPLGGIGVKFVMQNYSQNSNNYFENMLGETANIQCANVPFPAKSPTTKTTEKLQSGSNFPRIMQKNIYVSRKTTKENIFIRRKRRCFMLFPYRD